MKKTRVLILGGTSEASALARALARDARFAPMLSFAGRTRAPAPPPVPHRVGGFGGTAGLAAWLRADRTDLLVDATHPFAERISRNAGHAASQAGVAHIAVLRPAWRPVAGDRWTEAASVAEAACRLGPSPRRALLTIGQQELAPFRAAPHQLVVRSVDPPDPALLPAGAEVIVARGPFCEAEERALLVAHRIDVIVTKNSGGPATRAKLDAARALGIEVVMVARPAALEGEAGGETVPDAEAALVWLARHAALRGA